MEKINWFLAHRRNTSLNHMSIFVKGLQNNGFLPVVDFAFDNQIYVGKPGKGVYIFYDENQMNKRYKNIHKSIMSNKDFVEDFKTISAQIFSDANRICKRISETNLSSLTWPEFTNLFQNFISKITVGPIISVQLWGIEACLDKEFILSKEIMNKLKDSYESYDSIVCNLSISSGESVAYSERLSFLSTLKELQQEIKKESNSIESQKNIIKKHVDNFYWVNSEYISESLSMDQWLDKFRNEMNLKPDAEIAKLRISHNESIKKRNRLIKELNLSIESQHILNALDILISERDWAKGKYCYYMSIYDTLLEESASRLKTKKENLLLMTVDELILALNAGKLTNPSSRTNGFALVSTKGKISVIDSDHLSSFIESENLQNSFSDVQKINSFRGLIASPGIVSGRVVVIDDPKEIKDFQAGDIIVTYMTTMEFTQLFSKAKGIITDEGGMSSHAAIISREFNLPCIVGTKVATRVLKTGDKVELDANKGIVTIRTTN